MPISYIHLHHSCQNQTPGLIPPDSQQNWNLRAPRIKLVNCEGPLQFTEKKGSAPEKTGQLHHLYWSTWHICSWHMGQRPWLHECAFSINALYTHTIMGWQSIGTAFRGHVTMTFHQTTGQNHNCWITPRTMDFTLATLLVGVVVSEQLTFYEDDYDDYAEPKCSEDL